MLLWRQSGFQIIATPFASFLQLGKFFHLLDLFFLLKMVIPVNLIKLLWILNILKIIIIIIFLGNTHVKHTNVLNNYKQLIERSLTYLFNLLKIKQIIRQSHHEEDLSLFQIVQHCNMFKLQRSLQPAGQNLKYSEEAFVSLNLTNYWNNGLQRLEKFPIDPKLGERKRNKQTVNVSQKEILHTFNNLQTSLHDKTEAQTMSLWWARPHLSWLRLLRCACSWPSI